MRQPPDSARHGALLRGLVEAEARQDLRGARGGGMRANVVEPLVDLSNAMRVASRARPRPSKAARSVSAASTQSTMLSGAARRLLRHVADARRARHGDRAHVGREFAGDDLQQRRLAGAVAADKADLVPGRNARRRLSKIGRPSMRKLRSLMCSMGRA